MAFQSGLEYLSATPTDRTRSREAQAGWNSPVVSPRLSKRRWHTLENPSEKTHNLLEHSRKVSDVVEHQVIERYCVHCDADKTPTLDLTGQVIGQSRIGVRVAALIAYLRTVLRLPIRRIQEYLATVHGLEISIGEITRLLHAVRDTLDADVQDLNAQARASPVLYSDETGWREDGQNGYIWAFSTPGDDAVRYYEYDHSRGGGVVKRILAGQFQGHLVSDFYGGYNIYPGKHQRCWVHLLRDLYDLRKAHPLPPETVIPEKPAPDEPVAVAVHRWCQAVRAHQDAASATAVQHPDATQPEREAEYVRLTGQSHVLGLHYAQVKGHPCKGDHHKPGADASWRRKRPV
jgi:hypothetical protein